MGFVVFDILNTGQSSMGNTKKHSAW